MRLKRLILLLLALICVLPLRAGNEPTATAVLSNGSQMERPQWEDIGMHDVLAAPGGCLLTPPTTVRVLHETPTGTATFTVTHHAVFARPMASSIASRAYVHRGYIYLLKCLRL
ncbi:MAG: hypothetical protein IJ524_05145 [Bacteroidales bacterium]|nr:hypothetical protein [Bacteroidales bacterium]